MKKIGIHEVRSIIKPYGYNIENGWLVYYKNIKMDKCVKRLANFIAWPVALYKADDDKTNPMLEVTGFLIEGERLKNIVISESEFLRMKWPIKEWGLSVVLSGEHGSKVKMIDAMRIIGANMCLAGGASAGNCKT